MKVFAYPFAYFRQGGAFFRFFPVLSDVIFNIIHNLIFFVYLKLGLTTAPDAFHYQKGFYFDIRIIHNRFKLI